MERKRVGKVEHRKGKIQVLEFVGGKRVEIDYIFTTRGDILHTSLAKRLGAKLDGEGQVKVDQRMRTTVKGLYAAGCVTPANCQMIIAAGQGAAAAQATEILLASIARSDGTRASVTSHVLADRVNRGILGTFRFDLNGDMSPGPVTIYRVKHGRQTINRVVHVSSRLLVRRPTTGP